MDARKAIASGLFRIGVREQSKKLPISPLYKLPRFPKTKARELKNKGVFDMKATGIVRRIDDLGRVVIPKEIRRTMRIREGDPLLTTLIPVERYIRAVEGLEERLNRL